MKPLKSYNICFIGRTGNGKSSLINKLFNANFATHDLVSCTKDLFSVTKLLPDNDKYEAVTVYDTPGIGEFSSNSRYWRFYEYAIGKADCIVLVTTFDRTDAPVQRFLRELKPCLSDEKNVKFVVALNHIDTHSITDADGNYCSWNTAIKEPTEECIANIKERIGIIHEKFDNRFIPFEVIPVCAVYNYNIETLKNEILKF
ncbi:MAG: GTPase domain-containing protein [Barnesiella sp.]|nr:GTPase domain-containing protein [Barnesiella sp.]